MADPALALTRLELRRFRSHNAFDRDFDARPVAIHGRNGAGKTNILEAISMLSPGRGLRGAAVEEIAGRPDPIGWTVAAAAETLDGAKTIRVSVDLRDGRRRTVKIDDAAATRAALGECLRILWLTPAMDRLWMEGAGERRRFLDRTAMAFDPAHGERSVAYEKAMRERNRLLKEPAAADPHWLDALERRMAEAGVAIAAARRRATRRLVEAQAMAETAFPTAEIAIVDDVETEDAGALAETLGRQRGRDASAGRALIGPHRADLSAFYLGKETLDRVEAKLCSTGEQKALLISLVLATARALRADAGAAPLLLLDEVAAHLDGNRRAALYDEIVALGSQAWLTGVGPELFQELDDRAQYLGL